MNIAPNIIFAYPESVLDKPKARFRRLQNSLSAQTLAIAYLTLRQGLFVKLQLRKRCVTELIS
jgi:hypothetical protein